ncbi:hypothetical protein [Desulfosporosinus sp. OT]|uniref:hypothetical protein n=1 Tax=Desulfosporosinus sp. OT TaxID=913865 RepID=UPI000223ABF7|nr:hypothetical protein [Desulfosporosinus sp. OT]EGW39749.1 hypothetical protein DOT_2364 [Desulfosporosinus sp. OT]
MLFTKHKKIIVSLAVAVMSLGGAATAMAATTGTSLTSVSVGPLDLSKADIMPGTYTVVEGVTPHIEGGQTATTALNSTLTDASGVSVAAISDNVDASDFLGDNFTVETLGPQDLHSLTSGQNSTTAAK